MQATKNYPKVTFEANVFRRNRQSCCHSKSLPKKSEIDMGSQMIEQSNDVAAECLGVKVPHSPFLHDKRIERIQSGRYERQEIAAALALIKCEDRVLELGAGLGVVSAVIAKNVNPAAILSYEANPNLVPHIDALHGLNGIASNITLKNQVLLSSPDRPDEVEFFIGNSFLGASLINKPNRASRAISVPTADFETVRAKFKPTVLILDIEGGELDLLRHADLSGIRTIVIEFHPGAYGIAGMRACKTILKNEGFQPNPDHSTRFVWACERVS
jgi:FkbM family methyltransferase